MIHLDSHLHYISNSNKIADVNTSLMLDFPNHFKIQPNLKNHLGIDSGLVMPFPFRELLSDEENESVLELASRNSHIFPVCLLDRYPDCWILKGAVAIKEHFYGMRLASNDYQGSYRQIEQAGVPLITHLGSKGYTDKEAFYEAIFARLCDYKNLFPELKIVLAHAGCDFRSKIWNPSWEELLVRINKIFPDIHVDISGLTDVELLKHVVRVFPVERILFGSDFPYTFPKQMIALLESFLDDNQKERIFYRNAAELFNLSIGKTGSNS